MGAPIFLPYHCPRLSNGNFLRSPCAGKVAQAKALRAKFSGALLGALEHCLDCQGRDLVIREGPAVEYTGDIRPEVTREIATVRENRIVQEEEDAGMANRGVVVFKDELEAARVLGPDVIPPAAVAGPLAMATPEPGRFCKKCPGVESHRNKHGKYMGLCRPCLAQRAAENSRNRGKKTFKGKMTPAVARDLRKGIRSPGETPRPALCQPVCQNTSAAPEINVPPAALSHDSPRCITHNLPIKFNAKGVSLGGCEECRREIAAMGGAKAKILLAQNPLERLFSEHSEELEWLCSHARKQVRTPEGQVVFMVRQAMLQVGLDE